MEVNKPMNKKAISSSRKRRGIVCIILMVFFMLILIADLLNLALTPAAGAMDFSEFDPSSIPSFKGSGETPNGQFSMPEDFSMPEGGFNFPGGNTEDFSLNGQQPFGGGNSFLSLVRRAWLPILIVCLLGGGSCLFLYIRIRKKSSAGAQRLIADPKEGPEDDEDVKTKKKGGWILPACLVIAVAAVIASLPLRNSDTDAVYALSLIHI